MMELNYDEYVPLTPEQLDSMLKRTSWFQRQLYGSWLIETEQERKLRELAETYHTGCEAYDKRICSGTSPRTGEAMPMTTDEMRLINRHALVMRDEMIAEGERLGFTSRQVEEAIRKWVK